ncbi:chromosome alignment-maintaining phosphoprotein 1-like [Hypomesus transpacificus]|uniref:chromosome alignment-maintaining phosphoprotein 1-like n=1 Tax=Hypomesus transpacificus TaxID=137520 RepID=UPI001F08244B|nr:chromosome alignment-maintaining phosphoprotein 1-like [Hypomesus transpacificus]
MSADAEDSHLHCLACQLHFKSHSAHLTHMANTHPARLDGLPVGRLGNAVFYQPTARLFHCSLCFYTSNYYPLIYDHLLASHCLSEKGREKEERVMEESVMEERVMVKGEMVKGEMLKEGERVKGEVEEGENPDNGKEGEWEEGGEGHRGRDAPLRGSSQMQEEEGGGERNPCDISLKRKRSSATDTKDEDEEEEEEAIDPTQEQKEREVLDRYTLFSGNRYVCRLCGWKSKMKGFIMSHIVRSHNVPKPFSCQHCERSYILQSQLNSHASLWHRQGLYQCPFCLFSSDVLRGMRRHCTRCSTRLEGEGSEGEG